MIVYCVICDIALLLFVVVAGDATDAPSGNVYIRYHLLIKIYVVNIIMDTPVWQRPV